MATRTEGEPPPAKAGLKVCPYCKEQIRDAALKCRFCGEWLEGSNSKPGTEPVATPAQHSPADTHASVKTARADNAPAVETGTIAPAATAANPPASGPGGDYWYGYLYVLFCGYLTYCCATHLLGAAMKLAPVGDIAKQTEYWVGLPLWAAATAFFAYVTYKLARRQVTMGLIYTIVTLHGVNVLARGIYPGELVLWLVLSGIVVTKFRERKALEALEVHGANEDERYELLNRATRLETKGRVEEAIAAYRELAEKYPDSAAGQDARKSLESLEAKVSR